MERYRIIKKIGSGTFGDVFTAEDIVTLETVAIKIIKRQTSSLQSCLKLREIQALIKLEHPNLMALKGLYHCKGRLWIVCEYAQTNLYQEYVKSDQPVSEEIIRQIVRELVDALYYMHKSSYIHRDLKPQNILCSGIDKKPKICDFGLTRSIQIDPPYTTYVSTRWYRAPQLALRLTEYGSAVDVFALGCIMAELFTGEPLFPGYSQKDQLTKILKVMGTPEEFEWPDLYKHTIKVSYYPGTGLADKIPRASKQAINLLQKMLKPRGQTIVKDRILRHPFLNQRLKRMTKSQCSLTIFSPPSPRMTIILRPSRKDKNKCLRINTRSLDVNDKMQDTVRKRNFSTKNLSNSKKLEQKQEQRVKAIVQTDGYEIKKICKRVKNSEYFACASQKKQQKSCEKNQRKLILKNYQNRRSLRKSGDSSTTDNQLSPISAHSMNYRLFYSKPQFQNQSKISNSLPKERRSDQPKTIDEPIPKIQ